MLSPSAAKAGLDVSLFERLTSAGITPLLLRTQYRMHSDIAAFSSAQFYRGLVRNAADHPGSTPSSSVASTRACPCSSPVVLIDAPWGVENRNVSSSSPSWGNDAEVAVVIALLEHIDSNFSPALRSGPVSGHDLGAHSSGGPSVLTASPPALSVGVISPYSEQARRIKSALEATLRIPVESRAASGSGNARPRGRIGRLMVSTVDAFQGSEMDIIILSCVRSAAVPVSTGVSRSRIGFLSDPRRLNVAITRARSSLIVVGNLRYLAASDATWNSLIEHSTKNGVRIPIFPYHPTHAQSSGLGGGAVVVCPSLQASFDKASSFLSRH